MGTGHRWLSRSLACAIASLLTLASANAAEQTGTDAAEQKTLSKIRVQADEEPVAGPYTEDAASTATGLTLSLRDTPQSISVVTRERMDDQFMITVQDALANTTGVSVKPADRGRNSLSVRGFDVTNFQLDGVPVATGNIGLETTNTAIYERVEVVRGATGLMSGPGDPSAAINMVRKRADSGVFTGTLSADIGSWDRLGGSVDLSTPLNSDGSIRARFVASASEEDAFIDLESTSTTVVYAVVDADLGERTRLSIGASDQRDERDGVLWAGLPYWYTDGTRIDWSRDLTTATRWNRWDTKDQSIFATLDHGFSGGWTLRGDISYHRQREESMLLWMWGDPDPVTGEGMEAYPYDYLAEPEQIHGDIVVTGPFELFGRSHELTAGLMHSELEDGWSNRDAVDETMPPVGDIRDWDGSYPEPAMGERYVGSHGTTTQTALYAATRLQLTDAFKFIGGARLTNWKREEDAAAWTPEAYEIEHSNEITPYAGIIFDITTQWSAYASYTNSFKPQTYRDRNGRYLDPLIGNSYEAGLKTELLDNRLNAALAVFRIEQDNYAVVDEGQPPLPNGDLPHRTADGVTSEGYELEISGELTPGWLLTLGWTDFTARDADDVDVSVDHARQLLRLFTRYTLPGGWNRLSIGGGVNWEGGIPASTVNPGTGLVEKYAQPDYALVDLMAQYDFDRVSLQLNVNNVFDEKYRINSWWGTPFTYGEPRELIFSVDYRF